MELTNPGANYTGAPTVTIDPPPVGGTQATAIAILEPGQQGPNGQPQNNPRSVQRIFLTNPGSGYFNAPNIRIEGGVGGGGAKAKLNMKESIINIPAQELISGSGRWGLKWRPLNPGNYLINLEVVDEDGEVSFIEYNAEIIILPKLTSKVPRINIISEYDGQAFTSKSKLRFIAFAEDLDGKLEEFNFMSMENPWARK